MTNAFDPRVTVEVGTLRRTLGLGELAEALGVPTLRCDLLRLVVEAPVTSAVHSSSTQGVGGSKKSSLSPGTNENIDIRFRTFSDQEEEDSHSSRGARDAAPDAVADSPTDADRFADYLAETLRDEKSLRFFSLVARHVPREVIRDALMRAMDVPARDIRRSRGALFASLVLPHLRRGRT